MRAAAAILREILNRKPLILCYHSVAEVTHEDDPHFLCVRPDRFRAQLELLAAAGAQFVTVSEAARFARDGGIPPRVVAISFDDGYYDNLAVAAPTMRALGIPGTVFVSTGLVGQPSPWIRADSGVRMMDAAELRELANTDIEIGAHTITHPDLAQLDGDECKQEIGDGKAQLEELIERPVTAFAFPFHNFSDPARAAVRAAGFEAAVVGLGKGTFADPLLLPRVIVGRKEDVGGFVARVAGLHDRMYKSASGQRLRAATKPLRDIARGGRTQTNGN